MASFFGGSGALSGHYVAVNLWGVKISIWTHKSLLVMPTARRIVARSSQRSSLYSGLCQEKSLKEKSLTDWSRAAPIYYGPAEVAPPAWVLALPLWQNVRGVGLISYSAAPRGMILELGCVFLLLLLSPQLGGELRRNQTMLGWRVS